MQRFLKKSYGIVAACFLIQTVGVGTFVAYGVFFNALITEFGWSRGAISGASSLALFLSGLLAVIVGRLNDMYGPEKLMAGAALFFGAGLILMSQVETLWQLYLFYGIIFGTGLSGIDIIALTTTARWFTHSRGLMTGIVKVGTGAGQFTIPILASLLIASCGWQMTNVILGISAMFILFLLSRILQRDPGEPEESESIEREKTQSSPVADRDRTSLEAPEALRTNQLWILCSVNLLLVFSLMIILVHIVPHSTDIGLSPLQSAGVLSTIGGVSMFGRFIAGITIDKISSKFVMIACYLILISALLWLQFADSLWALYLFASVYGLAHGGFFTAVSPIVAEVFGTAAHGAIFGIVLFSGTTGGALGPVIAGFMFDTLGSYTEIFWILGMISCLGLFLIIMLKPLSSEDIHGAQE